MLVLVIGGSASGKSAFAEEIIEKIRDKNGNKYYLAFMKNDSVAAEKRIERHKKLRDGKGFITLEITCDVDKKLPEIIDNSVKKTACVSEHEGNSPEGIDKEKRRGRDTVLMESVGVLLANEMFGDSDVREDAGEYVLSELLNSSEYFENTVIVAEDVFADGNDYDEYSRKYIEALGDVNRGLAERADIVIEAVCSYPLWIKGERMAI